MTEPGMNAEGTGIETVRERLQQATTIGETLAAGFDGFELIRMLARSWDSRATELFATLMKTADAAVDGREAITCAPSLPAGGMIVALGAGSVVSNVDVAIGAVAEFAAMLSQRLSVAAGHATLPGDQVAFREAAGAAQRISSLTAAERR